MLHKKRVAQTIYYSGRRRIRNLLGLRAWSSPAAILNYSFDAVFERHAWIVRSILKHSPPDLDLRGKAVCEVGAGDCLASASLFLGKGARRVNIVEVEPAVVNEKQVELIEKLKGEGYPLDSGIIQRNGAGSLHLDRERIDYHTCFMEQFDGGGEHAFLFSFSVLEHVEDFASFYRSCHRALAPGACMLHLVDLGGHGLLDEPLPPLDFQTYPNWLYALMYPKYDRATRRFLNDHIDAIKAAGFSIQKFTPTRQADENYMNSLKPRLRAEARKRSAEELRVVEFAVLARKD